MRNQAESVRKLAAGVASLFWNRAGWLLAVILSVATLGNAVASDRNFYVVNDTPWPIYNIYVRQHGSTYWSRDMLGEISLDANRKYAVYVGDGDACFWDVRAKLSDAVDLTWSDVNLCTIFQMSIWYDFNNRRYQATY